MQNVYNLYLHYLCASKYHSINCNVNVYIYDYGKNAALMQTDEDYIKIKKIYGVNPVILYNQQLDISYVKVQNKTNNKSSNKN